MSTLTILSLNLLLLFVTGKNIHDNDIGIIGASCRHNAIVRVGEALRWRNPTNQTLHIRSEKCHTKFDFVIPPKQNATYVFEIRGICQYRSSACPSEIGILNVKGRIKRRSIYQSSNKDKACIPLCQGMHIPLKYVNSFNLCRYQYDYVIRGVVNRYYRTKDSKDHVEITVKKNYLHPVCQGNCLKVPTYDLTFLWMPLSTQCVCSRLKIGGQFLIMGFRFNNTLTIDTRSRSTKWRVKMTQKLAAFQVKVNKNPPCS